MPTRKAKASPAAVNDKKPRPARPKRPATKPVVDDAHVPSEPALTASPRIVCVTGAFGSIGRRLLTRLEADPDVDRVVAVDIKGPFAAPSANTDVMGFLASHPKLSAHTLDLSEPGADRELADIFLREQVGVLFHMALLSTPTHAIEMAHETETIGTLHVLRAAAEAKLGQIIGLSSALCYGAHADNPAFMTERQPLRPPASRSLRDRADVDHQLHRFAMEHPSANVAVARPGAFVGSAKEHFFSRLFARKMVPAVLGYDPLWQLLWIDDVINGIYALFKSKARGAYNITHHDILPFSHIISSLHRLPLYVPAGLGADIIGALWSAQLIDMPKPFLDYFRWGFICDSSRITRDTGFQAQHNIYDTMAQLSNWWRQ